MNRTLISNSEMDKTMSAMGNTHRMSSSFIKKLGQFGGHVGLADGSFSPTFAMRNGVDPRYMSKT